MDEFSNRQRFLLASFDLTKEEEVARHIEIIRYSRVRDRYLVSWGKARVREV